MNLLLVDRIDDSLVLLDSAFLRDLRIQSLLVMPLSLVGGVLATNAHQALHDEIRGRLVVSPLVI